MESSRQFTLAKLLGWVAACAFFFASSRWAVTSTVFGELGSPDAFSIIYVIGFPLMWFGLFAAQFICLGCLLVIIGLSLRNLGTSMSSLMFLGYGGLSLVASGLLSGGMWWRSGSRVLALMALCSCACVMETHFRKLPDWHRWVAGITIVATVAYYLHVAALHASLLSFVALRLAVSPAVNEKISRT